MKPRRTSWTSPTTTGRSSASTSHERTGRAEGLPARPSVVGVVTDEEFASRVLLLAHPLWRLTPSVSWALHRAPAQLAHRQPGRVVCRWRWWRGRLDHDRLGRDAPAAPVGTAVLEHPVGERRALRDARDDGVHERDLSLGFGTLDGLSELPAARVAIGEPAEEGRLADPRRNCARVAPILVPKVGFEPTRGCPQRCLRPDRTVRRRSWSTHLCSSEAYRPASRSPPSGCVATSRATSSSG
jgi:hypothetical protein